MTLLTVNAAVQHLSGIDREIVEASMQLAIGKMDEDKARLAIKKALATVGVMVGVAPPETTELNFLVDHVYKNYKTLTVQEILLAFSLMVSGKLENRISHFGVLSCDYFGQVVLIYQTSKKNAMVSLYRAKNDYTLIGTDQEIEFAPKTAFESVVAYVSENGKLPEFYNWQKVFDYLRDADLLPPVEVLSAFKEVIKARISESVKGDIQNAIDKVRRELMLSEGYVQSECRREWAKKYITENYLEKHENYCTK